MNNMNKDNKKIAVTSSGKTTDAYICEQFGRAPYFIIYDSASGNYSAYENPGEKANTGAGIKASEFIINNGVATLITGQLGDKASFALQSGGIQYVEGYKNSIKVKDAINNFLNK